MRKKKINKPAVIILIIVILVGLTIAILMDRKIDEPFAPKSTNDTSDTSSTEETTTVATTTETEVTTIVESEETTSETTETTEATATTSDTTTATSETTSIETTEATTETTVLYTEQAGYYSRYYDITGIYHRLAAEQGYEIPDPDATVGASFGLSLSEDGYFSISGNTSNAADSLAPVVGAGIYDAAASASASGTYTISGTSITFYASDGRVVSGSITGNCVSFVTPEPYSIQLALYK